MENSIISNFNNEIFFWKNIIIGFVNVETDPKLLRYSYVQKLGKLKNMHSLSCINLNYLIKLSYTWRPLQLEICLFNQSLCGKFKGFFLLWSLLKHFGQYGLRAMIYVLMGLDGTILSSLKECGMVKWIMVRWNGNTHCDWLRGNLKRKIACWKHLTRFGVHTMPFVIGIKRKFSVINCQNCGSFLW
jgi:hypothetical protein